MLQTCYKKVLLISLLLGVCFACPAKGADNPDELYERGSFAEAEKGYANSDMDNPKDLRFRYNRGCAAYQSSDYQGAMAAFSSVLRRAKKKDMIFKAAFNLGNAHFKQGDFASAVASFKKAIKIRPDSEDSLYNLELALRELSRKKENKKEEQESKQKSDSCPAGDKKNQSEKNQQDEKSAEKPYKDQSQEEKGEDQKKQDREQKADTSKEGKQENQEGGKQSQSQNESPRDLSGELSQPQALPKQEEGKENPGQAMSMIDKKKAEALLDNIKEDRTKFLRFQIPKNKEHGVGSGKDW